MDTLYYQIFYYTRCITSMRITSLRDPSLRHCARAKQLLSKNVAAVASRWYRMVLNVFDLTGPRFEQQTFRFRDERVTA